MIAPPGAARIGAVAGALAALAGCGHASDGPGETPAPSTGSVVFGVTSDLRAGVDVDRLHVVLGAAGSTLDERTIPLGAGDGGAAFPLELAARDQAPGTLVSLRLEALVPNTPATQPLVVRTASTRVAAGIALLDRVALQSACAAPLAGGPGGASPGWPACAPPDTCIDGACAASFTDPATLGAYAAGWNEDQPDPPCKPVLHAPAALSIGEGQSDYEPLAEMQQVQVEKGPQGGHHVWVALRMKNLHRQGTRTRLTAVAPETGTEIAPFEVIFGYDPDEGGWCKLYGLRFQLDAGGVALEPLLGKPLAITATAVDGSGDRASATRTVRLSADVL